MRTGFLLLALLALFAGCTRPPATAYVGRGTGRGGPAIAIGKNATGEACTQQNADIASGATAEVDIFCGTWQQPSAHVRKTGAADLAGLATASGWRGALDQRYACASPTPTTILGNAPALLMQCTRRVGGWPHVALVASVDGQAYLADGVLPVLPAIERAIGVLSGRQRADARDAGPSAADALLANRLAAEAFSSGDIGRYNDLMDAGTKANLAEDFAAAATAFRAALALQEKALGHDNPDIVAPLMHLALQVSDQGRYAEADALFARAQALAPRAGDPTAAARLLHYRGLHAMNQGQYDQALVLFGQAEAGYAALVPPAALTRRPASPASLTPGRVSNLSLSDLLGGASIVTDPLTQSALIGVIETRRNRAGALRALGRPVEAAAAIRSASDLARGNGLTASLISARLLRSAGTAIASEGDASGGASDLARASAAFARALPGTRPVAETQLLNAQQLAREGDTAGALAFCQDAVRLLRAIKAGVPPRLMQPCLAVFAQQAERLPEQQQAILAAMFEAAQLAQGGVTSQQIAQATARLSENARDPKVAAAIRHRQDVTDTLGALYRERDAAADANGGAQTSASADLDRRIAAAQAEVADADAALQAASPNFGQLVQEVAPASEVLAALHPGEAFAAITLAEDGGFVLLLRDHRITASRIAIDRAHVADLVRRVRAGIEPTTEDVPRFDTEAAQALYAATLGGVGPALDGATSLVVAPTGVLLSLPFEVLLTGPARADDLRHAPWLLRRMTIAHVPAAANFVSLRKIAGGSRAQHPWFGFGDFRPVTLAQAERSFPGDACADSAKLFAGLPPLPFARRELDAARGLLGAAPEDELLGPAFTAPAVLKAALKDYRILHFATHALLPSDLKCQSEPAIVTSAPAGAADASGALLTASAVVGLDLDADAVILSACNSGGPGGSTAGESLSGLARSFFFAGARALMVTHWSVNDQTAAYLIADTLRRLRLQPQAGIAGALRDAQLAMLDGAGSDLPAAIAHPFYWAPFALIGEGGGAAPRLARAQTSLASLPDRVH